MSECVFCKIRDKQIPSALIYEDKETMAFLDIAPIHPGHTLVVPKHHYATLFDADDATVARLFTVSKKLGKAIMDATGAGGLNVGVNNHPVSGQVVPHLHVHLIPRHQGDGLTHWPHKNYAEDEMNQWANKIRSKL